MGYTSAASGKKVMVTFAEGKEKGGRNVCRNLRDFFSGIWVVRRGKEKYEKSYRSCAALWVVTGTRGT